MPRKSALSQEMRNAIVWLERQPGVQSVVQGRYVRTRHHHKPGFTRVVQSDDKSVRLRVFDKMGSKDLTVWANRDTHRDSWVVAVVSGDVVETVDGKPRPSALQAAKSAAAAARSTAPVVAQHAAPEKTPDGARVVQVSPEMAEHWLERNTRNRKLRDSVVNKYAADMKAGRWMLTGDAIQFDTTGAVINGQHRLWAVFSSGVTVPMLVMEGLAPETVAVLDDHLKRNLADVVTIQRPGATVTSIHTAIANMLLRTSIVATAVDRNQALQRVTRQDQLQMLDRHWEAIEFAFRECFRSQKIRGIATAGVITPVVRAAYTCDRDRLKEFGRVMTSGVPENPQDDIAAVNLRNYLLRFSGAVRAEQEVVYKKTERALLAFVERERLGNLYEAQHELFPLPEEQAVPKQRRRG